MYKKKKKSQRPPKKQSLTSKELVYLRQHAKRHINSKLHEQTVRVTRNGIKINGKYYWCEKLAYYHNEKLNICYSEDGRIEKIKHNGISIDIELPANGTAF